MQIDNLRARTESIDAESVIGKIGERQSLVVDALPIVFYTAAPKGRFSGPRFLSESIAGAIGYTADAFVDDPDLWAARIHPDDRIRLERHLRRMNDTGSLSIEYRWRCADGSERVFLDQGVLERDASGVPRDVLGTCLDITDRSELGRKMALSEKAAPAGGLPRSFVHDFNNVLSAIIWNLDLLGRSAKASGAETALVHNAMGSALNGLELLRQFSSGPQPLIDSPQVANNAPVERAVILVVEDEEPLRRTAVALMQHMGHRVLEATDAAAALDILRTDQAIDLLFTDVVMIGGMDGFTLARRAVELKPGMKVLLTSGYMPAIEHIKNLSDKFLSKPYSGEELRRALATALHKDSS